MKSSRESSGRLVNPYIIFSTLYATLLNNLIKEKLGGLSRGKKRFILTVTIEKRFSLLQTIEGIIFGLVRMYVTPYCIS